MEIIREANLEYEAEIHRNPESPFLWEGYLNVSKNSSYGVCRHPLYSFYCVVPVVAIPTGNRDSSEILQNLDSSPEGNSSTVQ